MAVIFLGGCLVGLQHFSWTKLMVLTVVPWPEEPSLLKPGGVPGLVHVDCWLLKMTIEIVDVP